MTLQDIDTRGLGHVSYFKDDETGLEAIVSVYDTTLGPAVGGTRILDYDSQEKALADALRLSKAMTYKIAASDVDLGGAKAVIIGDPDEIKDEELLHAYGRAVDSLQGKYVAGEDVNTNVSDLRTIREETDYVWASEYDVGVEATAEGVYHGMQACLERVYGDDSFEGRTVTIQGCGKVGTSLTEMLVESGAHVKVSDVDEERVEDLVARFGAEAVGLDEIYDEECDVFAPCALGGVLNDETIPRLKADIVAGSANNMLEAERHADQLADRDILYAPDFVINAGGFLTGYVEAVGRPEEDAFDEAAAIGDRLHEILDIAEREEISTVAAAETYAERRMDDRTEPAWQPGELPTH